MTNLAEFQRRTVDVAIEALEMPGSRRFLVADEVGLGKTIIAREVAKGLREKRRRLNIVYFCPSLEIVGQNRSKFISLTGVDEKNYDAGEDRLTLVPAAPPEEGKGYRVFSFTPETSLPGWKPGPRTGRKAERALIRRLLDRYDQLRPIVLRMDREHGDGVRQLLAERAPNLEGYTFTGIEQSLRDIFRCPTGNIEKAVVEWIGQPYVDIGEFIGRFRSALALAALRSRKIRPDLVILDEFHRYADLILPKQDSMTDPLRLERVHVHGLLVDALLGGDTRPAVLLLSATPYRLRRLNGEELHPVEHYKALVDLAGFLADDPECRDRVEAAMRDYHDALRTPGTAGAVHDAVHTAKMRLEALLSPLMARTERALVHRDDLFEREIRKVDIEARDLKLYRHLAQNCGSRFAGWAPQIWSSIPYPAQTLHAYAMWKSITEGDAPPFEAGAARHRLAHPQLRSFAALVGNAAELNLPWQPPTIPWWRLEGPWTRGWAKAGKSLLFSRWRGAPTSISALLSIDLMGGLKPPGSKRVLPLLRPGGTDSSALVALFMPWPNLSNAVEPMKGQGRTIDAVRRDAETQLAAFLDRHGIATSGSEKRPNWFLACGIERDISKSGFNRIASIAGSARGVAKACDWKGIDTISEISKSELAALANYLLCAPGAIMARCARRHGIPLNEKWRLQRVFDFGWDRLRGYLGHRAFANLILQSSKKHSRYPDALCEAMLKGSFEAVIDEQMVLLGELGDASGFEIIEQLGNSLLDRPSLIQFRRGSSGKHRVPAQAITPFSAGERRMSKRKKGARRLRNDMLRHAFNSPFWPHILCTTSVGQEGLDFHKWCRRIVHWDLPADPVDFEQREGRIARYASLAVRRSLADAHGKEALAASAGASPFGTMLDIARQQPLGRTGLERWWLPTAGRPISVTFDWKFSLRSARKEQMLKDLLYYRLALGQPDPEAFMDMLERIGADAKQARGLAIDLSAISRMVPGTVGPDSGAAII